MSNSYFMSTQKLKSYFFPILLFFSILAGGLTGYFQANITVYLKPIGDIFLNLILVSVVPLIFFSVSSTVEKLVTSKTFFFA
jgi:Na+/H+-dicarboxylate symporter